MLVVRSAFAVMLLTSVPTFAAPQNGSSDQHNERLAQRDRDQEQERQRGQGPERGAPQGENRREGPQGQRGEVGPQGERGGSPAAQAGPNRGPQVEQRRPAQTARGRGPVEHGPAQFEKRAFQRNFTAPRRFRAAGYRPPPG